MPTYPTPRYIHSGRSIHDPSIQLKDWWDGTYDEPVVFVYNDQTVAYRYRDSEGRLWEEWWRPDGTYNRNTSDSGDPYDSDAWRRAEPDEEPMGRSVIYQQPSRPLEETTPLFGPQEEPVLEPDYGLGAQPREGHWDPVSLRWVPDEPTSSVGKVLDDTPWDQPREGQPTTMRSAGILGHDAHTGSRDESRPAANEESSDDGSRGPLRPGHDADERRGQRRTGLRSERPARPGQPGSARLADRATDARDSSTGASSGGDSSGADRRRRPTDARGVY
jgi:hypothetical protein